MDFLMTKGQFHDY